MNNVSELYQLAVDLLAALIHSPSFSKEEGETASLLYQFFQKKGVAVQRRGNNVYAQNLHFNNTKPTLLLNSHHDTVKPVVGYTSDPFEPIIKEGKLYGLGSNDAGGSVVCLIAAFLHFYERDDLPYNLVLAITAEEEISGSGGIESLLPLLPPIHCAIVGEPTGMQMAVAERGLLVLDAVCIGKGGHAARAEGDNALYKAVADINILQKHRFKKISDFLGPVQVTVTVIETSNKAHNQVPDQCRYVIDIRLNEHYSHEEVIKELQPLLHASLTPRSLRIKPTIIASDHPLVEAGNKIGLKSYGSPTTSDKALIPAPSLKIGPGDSARSHTADEYILLSVIEEGIKIYLQLINHLQ